MSYSRCNTQSLNDGKEVSVLRIVLFESSTVIDIVYDSAIGRKAG